MQSGFITTTIARLVLIKIAVFARVVRSLAFTQFLPPVLAHDVEVFSTGIVNHFGGVVCLIPFIHVRDDY